MTTTISVTGSNNDTALVLDSNYGNIAATPNEKTASNLINLGIFSNGDFESLIYGPWTVYKMPTPMGTEYRYISKNNDSCMCWAALPNPSATLTTEELESPKGLILNLTKELNGPLCAKITDTGHYYANFNANPFVLENDGGYPLKLTIAEVKFEFTDTTFTESPIVTSAIWTTGPNNGKPLKTSELQGLFGTDAGYFKSYPAFVGTKVTSFMITQTDIDNILGTFTHLPPSVYASNLYAVKLYLGDNTSNTDKNSVLPATIMNPVDQDYLSFLLPYRTGNEYNPLSPDKGLSNFDSPKILGGSYVIPYSENCPGTVTLQTCLYGKVPWSKTGLIADGINIEGTTPVPDNKKILSNPYVQQYFQYALAPMFYWEHYFGMDLTKSTNASIHGLTYLGDGQLRPKPAFVEQAKSNPKWASLKDQIWKGNTSTQNLWNTTWQLVNSTRDAFNAVAYGFDPSMGELQDYFNINWVNHGVVVADLFQINPDHILINDTVYGTNDPTTGTTKLSLLQAHIGQFAGIYFDPSLGYYATYNEVEKIVNP